MTLFCKTFRKVSLIQVVGLQYFSAFIRVHNDTMTLFLRKNHIHKHRDTLATPDYIYIKALIQKVLTRRRKSCSYAYVMLEERISDMRNVYAKRNEE